MKFLKKCSNNVIADLIDNILNIFCHFYPLKSYKYIYVGCNSLSIDYYGYGLLAYLREFNFVDASAYSFSEIINSVLKHFRRGFNFEGEWYLRMPRKLSNQLF